ncbi:MAG: NAD(P)H-binding protein, partial [Acidimicrobiales bacterium]
MSSDEYRVFISGGTGVIGRRVVPLLLTAGHQVTAIARTETKAAALEALGARPVQIDIFSKPQVLDEVADHDVVLHLATNIPTGSRAALKSAWRTNDRLRSEAAANLAAAAIQTDSKRYVGESITFPYVDLGDEWIPESAERSH